MKIAIIGTNGFLSTSIGKICNKKHIELEMYGLTTPERHSYDAYYPVDLIKDDFPYEQIMKSDMIIYAVGAGIQSNLNESADLIYTLNVAVPVKICNQLKQIGYEGVFVSFGSYFEIGENYDDHFFTETEFLQSQKRTRSDYSISKRMFSRFISSVEMPYKTWHFILPTIYGENELGHRLIPYTINALKTNAPLEFTSGEQVRQYIYIEEVAEIILQAYRKNIESGIYNVAGTETLTVKELVTALFTLFNKNTSRSLFGKAKREDTGMKVLKLDGTKLFEATGFKPGIKIADVYDRY